MQKRILRYSAASKSYKTQTISTVQYKRYKYSIVNNLYCTILQAIQVYKKHRCNSINHHCHICPANRLTPAAAILNANRPPNASSSSNTQLAERTLASSSNTQSVNRPPDEYKDTIRVLLYKVLLREGSDINTQATIDGERFGYSSKRV